MALKRLQKEFRELMQNPLPFGTVQQTNEPLVWNAYLNGPEGSPYEGGIFQVEIRFPVDYPNRTPAMRFITKIFHANIAESNGFICLSLMADWLPTDSVTTIFIALNNLLTTPNRSSAYRGSDLSESEYNFEAKRLTQLYAIK